MKNRKRLREDVSFQALPDAQGDSRWRRPLWVGGIALLVALFAALVVYAPAIDGPFVFDDYTLPFRSAQRTGPLELWMSTVRPVLMLSYWLNYQMSGPGATVSYHLTNLVIHALNAVLVGAILWQILGWRSGPSQRRCLLASAGACVFLLHPLQSESVAYIAGRSESLSALWCLCAWTISLYRPAQVLSWPRAFAILGFFALALATKENTVALAGVLLLTDLFSSRAPLSTVLRRNWRLYSLLGAGALLGMAAAWRVVAASTSAGFQGAGVQWNEYALTQGRVVWQYVRLALLPVGLTVDHDVALSRSFFDAGAGIAAAAWIAVVVAAVLLRRRYALACYGLLVFLILLAPTSSVVPIKDVMAERRMYLPLLGLILIALEFGQRARATNWTIGAVSGCVALGLGIGTCRRSEDWSDGQKLWLSAISATPQKIRPYENLASVYLSQRRCDRALGVFHNAERAGAPVQHAGSAAVWALALECSGDATAAIAKMEASVATEPTVHSCAALGRMYLKAGRLSDAEESLAKAEALNPDWELTYVYRAMLKMARGDYPAASAELRRVLSANPTNLQARHLLQEAMERSRTVL